jgi:regulator of extracellular matrix RemA (YlzA/DUF370 family)
MAYTLLNIGHGSTVAADEVIAILSPNSAPIKRLREEAREGKRLIDATHGRKLRSVILLKTNHLILSASLTETLSQRYAALNEKSD